VEPAQRVEADPDDVELLSVLSVVDAYLGRKQEAIEEGTRAVEVRPISPDAVEGPWIRFNLAVVANRARATQRLVSEPN